MRRRTMLRAIAGGALASATGLAAAEMPLPKTIRLIVAFPPGGQSDLIARLTAQALGPLLGVTMVVENRPGAGGAIGVEVAARARADGSTLLLGSASSLTIAPVLDSALRYDTLKDFETIGRVARLPLVLMVRAELPVMNVPQLIEHARKHPGALTYASGAMLVQFAFESLKTSTGVDILQVPYGGTAPALQEVLAGRIDLLLADVGAVVPHVASGRIRVIANAGQARSQAFPEVPTMIEQGFDLYFESWQGLLAPSGTPVEVVARLQVALHQALGSNEFRKALEGVGAEPIDEAPAMFATFLRNELERYRRLAKR